MRVSMGVLVLSLLLLNISPVAAAPADDPVAVARSHIEAHGASYGLSDDDVAALAVSAVVPVGDAGASVVYLQQRHQGITVHNAAAHVAVGGDGEVLHVAHSLVPDVAAAVRGQRAVLSDTDAAEAAAAALALEPRDAFAPLGRARGAERSRALTDGGIAREPIPVGLVYQPLEDGSVRLAWSLGIYEDAAEDWWQIRVDAETGEELDRHNLVTHDSFDGPEASSASSGPAAVSTTAAQLDDEGDATAAGHLPGSYRVFAEPVEAPSFGGRSLVTNPAHHVASPYGWHDTDGAPGPESTLTMGNNAHAYTDTDADNIADPGSSPDGGAGLTFDFPLDLSQAPSSYRPASVTNAFYWVNRMHDILYTYGFNEVSGNFQVNNYGRGGLANDPIRVEIQDGGGTNNANFSAGVDGNAGRMQLYVWTAADPDRDGALDNAIIVHEVAFGATNRMTGGPATMACLSNQESTQRGFTDWFALMLTMKPGDTGAQGRGIATYALGQAPDGPGIRPFRYSTDMTVDPRTYDTIKTATVPHGIGSTFTSMLWEVSWGLIDEHGFDPRVIGGNGGNNVALQLAVDALKLQPCNPGFADTRDALLAADELNYGGDNACIIWKAFAKRGLGVSAVQGSSANRSDGTEAFDAPAACLAPDLVVGSLDDPPAERAQGESFTVSESTRNVGDAPAGQSITRYYLSTDDVHDEGDRLLSADGRAIPALPPDGSDAGAAEVTVPADLAPGTYLLIACADDTSLVEESDETNNCAASVGTMAVVAAEPDPPEAVRLSIPGGSRIDTAVAISQHEFTDPARATRVYLARADDFPDALAGGSVTDGPILLVHSSGTLPPVVRTEIDRLDPGEVVALGGTAAVSDGMLDQAAAERGKRRLSIPGGGRIDTAIAISRHVYPDGSTADATAVYLARADDFPDALAGGVLADGPVLLVNRTGAVPAAVRAEIQRLGPARVIALGGLAAVSDETLATAGAGFQVDRLSVQGGGRTQTALAIARHAFPGTAEEVYLARADQFPDALAGGALTRGPILLVPRTLTRADGTVADFPPDVAAAISGFAPARVVALGGTAAVADEVLQAALGD